MILTEDQVDNLVSVEKERSTPSFSCMLWKMVQRNDAGHGGVVVLHKSINNDVDNVFGFPASNKGNLLFLQI